MSPKFSIKFATEMTATMEKLNSCKKNLVSSIMRLFEFYLAERLLCCWHIRTFDNTIS